MQSSKASEKPEQSQGSWVSAQKQLVSQEDPLPLIRQGPGGQQCGMVALLPSGPLPGVGASLGTEQGSPLQ